MHFIFVLFIYANAFIIPSTTDFLSNDIQMLELQEIGSRHPSMDSLNGAPPDATHLHPEGQYTTRRSPSLRLDFYKFCQKINIYSLLLLII